MQNEQQGTSTAIEEPLLAEAAAHLKTALGMLDKANAPGHIGAYVDLAICELQKVLPSRKRPVHS